MLACQDLQASVPFYRTPASRSRTDQEIFALAKWHVPAGAVLCEN